jgi:hypothetical protein
MIGMTGVEVHLMNRGKQYSMDIVNQANMKFHGNQKIYQEEYTFVAHKYLKSSQIQLNII